MKLGGDARMHRRREQKSTPKRYRLGVKELGCLKRTSAYRMIVQGSEDGCSRCERKSAARATQDQLFWDFLLRQIDKILPAAMHRHNMSNIELL